MATTCCRCSRATGSWVAPTSRPTAPRASSTCGASIPSRERGGTWARSSSGRRRVSRGCSASGRFAMREVPIEEARRIAVRAQGLDGGASGVLETVRRLGFLQLDPISTVAPPQHLVLWSRLGERYDSAELDRLLWQERKLIEWNAFLWPAEDLPLLKARMRRRDRPLDRRIIDYLKEHAGYRRYILRELERRGPLLSREIADHEPSGRE